MSEMSPELRELVLATKNTSLATADDAARVLVALRARLGDAAVLGIEAAQAVPKGSSSGLALNKVMAALGLSGLAILGGIGLNSRHHGPSPSVQSAIPSNTVTSPVVTAAPSALDPPNQPPATEIDTETTTTDTNPTQSRSEVRTAASRIAKDRLAEEVALLSRAETALHSGRPAVALQVLNEHEHLFRNGQLAEERIAARVQALCALGRSSEADAQLARLSPKSLHGGREGRACESQVKK